MKNTFYLLVGILFIVGCAYIFLQSPAHVAPLGAGSILEVGSETFRIEIRDSAEERELGLSGRDVLPAGEGMLFVFDTPGPYGFWMKDMRFPIDIVWIDESRTVVGVGRGVTPDSYPQVFYPPVPIKYVLEISPGQVIDIGSKVSF